MITETRSVGKIRFYSGQ